MVPIKNAVQLFSPLDVIVLELETQEIVRKRDREGYNEIRSHSLQVERYLLAGNYPERNPTHWQMTQGKSKSETPNWQDILEIAVRGSGPRVKWTDLDNNSMVVTVTSEISMILVNFENLTPEMVKEIKCATIYTAFGKVELDLT